MRGKVLACSEQHFRRRASYQSVRTRDLRPPREGRENLAYRKVTDHHRDRPDQRRRIADVRIVVRRRGRSCVVEAFQRGLRLSSGHERRSELQCSARLPTEDERQARSPVPGHRSQGWSQGRLTRTSTNALSENGGRQCRHARPSGASNDDRAEQGKRLAPPFRGNADMNEAESHLIAGPRRRSREQQGNDEADGGRTDDGEDILSGQKSQKKLNLLSHPSVASPRVVR